MSQNDLNDRVKKLGINKLKKKWIHCDEKRWSEFKNLVEVWAKQKIQDLPVTQPGIKTVKGRITFKVNDHYFRSLAKIAFHFYLLHSRRGFRGDEECFRPIRDFIMNGGNIDDFFNKSGPKFAMPFGKIPSGGVITPNRWCHVIASDETSEVAIVYIQLFVGLGCVPTPHYIKLAGINSTISVPNSTWGYAYVYDNSPSSDRCAGQVEQAHVKRIR